MSHEEIPRLIGQRIYSARRDAGWTRQQLSTKAEVSERYLAQLEKGEANVSVAVLLRVTRALDFDRFDLFAPAGNDQKVLKAGPDPKGGLENLLEAMTVREREQAGELIRRTIDAGRRSLCGVALIGLRGAGKSTLGGRLAERCGLPFIRLTSVIEENAGMRVDEIFNLGGQEAFRGLEAEAIAHLVGQKAFAIVETSGGIVVNKEAYDTVLARFRTVWLKTSPEQHMDRVVAQGDLRPISGHSQAIDHLRALLNTRTPSYAQADFALDTFDRAIEDCADELYRLTKPLLKMMD